MITTTKRSVPFRGQNKASTHRDFQDEVVTDLINLKSDITANTSSITNALVVLSKEVSALKSDLAARDEEYDFFRSLDSSQTLTYVNGFNSSEDISYHADTPSSRRCVVDTEFGEILPPRNNIENMFYKASLNMDGSIYPKNISFNVSTNEPSNAEVETGDIRNAFNGNNMSYWIRKVKLPIQSDVTSVSLTLTVTVPSGQVFQPNEMYMVPFPYKGVEITNLEYSTDLTGNYRSAGELDNRYGKSAGDGSVEFTPMYGASPFMLHFQPTNIAKIRIQITQDNWVEENGYKVFYYGAQEIGLRFVDYDKTNDPDTFNHESNNNAIVKIKAPANKYFSQIKYFKAEPWDSNFENVRWQISTDEDFNDVIWSHNQPLPQANSTSIIDISTSTDVLYVKVLPLFVDGAPSASSPFYPNSPAFVDAMALQYTVRNA